MTGDDLEKLRAEIAETDRELFALLARRMELSGRIGAIKAERGEGVSVRAIEDQVLARARAASEACGVSGPAMEAIFRAIVQASVERQHAVGLERRAKGGGRVLLVGAEGGMGRWFRGLFDHAGHDVVGVDPRGGVEHASLADVPDLDRFDWILVATPLGTTAGVLDELVLRAPRRATVVEVSSIQAALAHPLARARAAGVSVIALHPMFGPGKSVHGPLTFALAVRTDEARETERVRALLAHPYARIVAMPFEHHDRMMGWLLGLAHLSGMLFASALARSGLDAAELEACASTTFARQKATALSILGEDPALYLDIQRLNPHREAVYAAVGDALAELAELVRRGDKDAFAQCLERARAAIGPAE
ncbi:MAG: prephenate dehydrogenase/arogenate dehydrogenase family protein [Planctomycetes bacterium]|nr:prephenate dehydrogenase/arogenate dehydrogenase family protein [Planctomycetota bacterium]